MKQKINSSLMSLFILVTLSYASFGFTTRFGLDTYKIYLNNKLVLDLAVNQPKSARVLELGKVSEKEQLRINYTHCMNKSGGTNRSIALRDEKGSTLKKWTFADAKGADQNMAIAMKELLNFKKTNSNHQLSLHYSANELPKGEILATLHF